jgi:hypothetical protein
MTSAASSNQAAAADAGGESGQAAQEEDAPHVPVLLEEIMGFWRDRPMQVPQHVIPPTPARTLHLGFGKPPLESRATAAARLGLEVCAGWARPSSRCLWVSIGVVKTHYV